MGLNPGESGRFEGDDEGDDIDWGGRDNFVVAIGRGGGESSLLSFFPESFRILLRGEGLGEGIEVFRLFPSSSIPSIGEDDNINDELEPDL